MHGVVCNTEIMVLLITLNSHFHTNQYKLYSYSSYHMFYKKSNHIIICKLKFQYIIMCSSMFYICMVALLYYIEYLSFTNCITWKLSLSMNT